MSFGGGILEEVEFDAQNGTITLTLRSIAAPRVSDGGIYYYIDIFNPRDVYDKVVVIDAGHGGEDLGSSHGGVHEKNINIAIARKLYSLLEEHGIKPYMTRWDDEYIIRDDRYPIANEIGDMLISLHVNADEHSNIAVGVQNFFATNGSREKDRHGIPNRYLGDYIVKHINAETGARIRETTIANRIVILYNAKIPAVLIEMGFMTTPGDRANLTNEDYQMKMATGFLKGILEAFDSASEEFIP
jgi:N-acetylmuramoyl-L-alanine amidase